MSKEDDLKKKKKKRESIIEKELYSFMKCCSKLLSSLLFLVIAVSVMDLISLILFVRFVFTSRKCEFTSFCNNAKLLL